MKKSLCASTAALAPDKNLAHQTLIQALKIALIGATIIVLAEGSSIAARVLITGVAALIMNESIKLLRSHFGLTHAEARLALHLVAGETLRCAAVKLSITYETARNS